MNFDEQQAEELADEATLLFAMTHNLHVEYWESAYRQELLEVIQDATSKAKRRNQLTATPCVMNRRWALTQTPQTLHLEWFVLNSKLFCCHTVSHFGPNVQF